MLIIPQKKTWQTVILLQSWGEGGRRKLKKQEKEGFIYKAPGSEIQI